MNSFIVTEDQGVEVVFDIENQHLKQLLGFDFPQFAADEGFYFRAILDEPIPNHYGNFKNFLLMNAMYVPFKEKVIELTEEVWYNLSRLAYEHKLIMLDGELLATNLPVGEVPRFLDVWGSPEYLSHMRTELLPN